MNAKEIFQMHKETAQLLCAMFNHQGAISINAGSLKYVIKPGSIHYEKIKDILSDFGCDYISQKHHVDLNTCTQTNQAKVAG